MFLPLTSQAKDQSAISQQLVLECYRLAEMFPPEERFEMASQIKRAALHVHINITEGASTKSVRERRKFFRSARAFLVEIDLCLDIGTHLGYLNDISLEDLGEYIYQCNKVLMAVPETGRRTRRLLR